MPHIAPRTRPTSTRFLVLGGGRMGMALAQGWKAAGISSAQITVIEPDPARRDDIAAQHFAVFSSLAPLPDLSGYDALLLAVKPQQFPSLRADLAARLRTPAAAPLVLSIMAGIPLAALSAALPGVPNLVRAMPNTPSLIGKGISACYALPACPAPLRTLASQLLEAVGEVVWLAEEAHMDAVTALSGSGPAYVYYFLECLIAAGTAQGLAPEIAHRLALATLTGAGILATGAKESLAELRCNVTSPGGTTEAALEVLMHPSSGMAPLLAATLDAAAARARTLAHTP